MKIYISNLGGQVTDESLGATFATHGKVGSSQVVLDDSTGFSKGFAFIDMPNEKEAALAISKMNGTIINGQAIEVRDAGQMR